MNDWNRYDKTVYGQLKDLTGVGWEILTDSEGNELAIFIDGNFKTCQPKIDTEEKTIAA